MTTPILDNSLVDSMQMSLEIIALRTSIIKVTIERAQRLVPRYLEKNYVWIAKAGYFSEQAFKEFKAKLTQTFPDPKYKPFLELTILSQETFFTQKLSSKIEALVSIKNL
jgi:hypothetical protein